MFSHFFSFSVFSSISQNVPLLKVNLERYIYLNLVVGIPSKVHFLLSYVFITGGRNKSVYKMYSIIERLDQGHLYPLVTIKIAFAGIEPGSPASPST